MDKQDLKQQALELLKKKSAEKVSEYQRDYKLPNKDKRNES